MKNNNRLLYVLAFSKFIIPFFLQNGVYEPHRDEFLYLAEGQHMAWGFMEVPPLLSVFAWLTNLLGDGFFWIKFWPSLFGAFTFILVGKTIFSLGGGKFALLLGFLGMVLGAYMRVHYLFQPNFLEIFFWTAIAFCGIRFIQTNQNNWLYLMGVSIGLGMMSKYSVAFFVVSVFIGLLLTKERKIFTNKHFYYSLAIALIIFLPNFIWQYIHHFPVAYHMKELQRTQLQYVTPSSFLINQLVMNLPVVFIWLAGLCSLFFAANQKKYRFLGWAYFGVISLLLLGHGKYYYALGIYPVLFGFGAYWLEQLTELRFKVLRYLFVLSPCLFIHLFIPIALPIFEPERLATFYKKNDVGKIGVLKWEDGKNHPLPQDFADMLGWKEMAGKVAKAYQTLDSNEKAHAIIFCDNYGQAGAINFYGKQYHLPVTYSDNASFFYWMPPKLQFDNLVLVTDDEDEMQHPFIKEFKSAVLFDSITNNYAREKGSLIIVLKGANEQFTKMFNEKIQADRDKLNGDGSK
jgi:hypothetical protein